MTLTVENRVRNTAHIETESSEIPHSLKMTELGLIPEDWDLKCLGDVCWVNQGLQIAIEKRLKHKINNSKTYITIQFLNNGKEAEYVDDYSPSVCCTEEDILMTRTGNTGVVVTGVDGVFHNNFFKINYTKKFVDKSYLTYYLISDKTQKIILCKAGTSTIPDLNHNDFYSILIPLPGLIEQQAIAAALSDIDSLISSLDQLIVKKQNIKLATMKQLLTGKQLLPGFSGKWEKKQLNEIADYYSGGTPLTSNSHYYKGDIFWITSGDLNQRYIKNVKGKITTLGLNNSAAKMVKKGTLLIALYGATAGVTAITQIDAAINQAILAIIPKYDHVYFLFHYFELKKNWLINTYTQGGQPNLSGDIIKSIEILMPALEEQTAIAKVLTDMDTELSALEQQLNKARNLKQGMMQELLTGRIRLK